MTELSLAAKAVAKAALYVSSCDPEDYPHQAQEIAAAALRAAADQLTFEDSLAGAVINPRELLDIADELDGGAR